MSKCEGCDVYVDGRCTKFRKNGKAEASDRRWLDALDSEFISEYRMCRRSSIFGNEWIGLTAKDIERIKNGEILHIPGEYGIFIGVLDEEKGKTNE